MRDPDFMIRWELANLQGDVRDERALPALGENVLRDVDPHVRWRSLWAIGEYPVELRGGLMDTFRAALRDAEPSTRWNAAIALSNFELPDGLSVLHEGFPTSVGFRRWEAINAFGRIHDERTVPLLASVLRDGEVRHRSEAALSLGRIGTPPAVGALLGALGDASPDVRWRACMALADSTDERARPALESLLRAESDAEVRRQAERALARHATTRR
jgi:hypothetical protein